MTDHRHVRPARSRPRHFARSATRCAAVLIVGAIAARMVMLTIDIIVGRNGGNPGGEVFLPIYAIMLPALGWYLRGVWYRTILPEIREYIRR